MRHFHTPILLALLISLSIYQARAAVVLDCGDSEDKLRELRTTAFAIADRTFVVVIETIKAEERYQAVEQYVLPCAGTSKQEVDAVFGEPYDFGSGKGERTPRYSYGGRKYGAFIRVGYVDDKVVSAQVFGVGNPTNVYPGPTRIVAGSLLQSSSKGNHSSTENLPPEPEITAVERERISYEYWRENLEEFKAKFEPRLRDASWNKGKQ